MGKNPFGEYASRYLDSVRGMYADETIQNRTRRYKRMAEKVKILKDEKKISTASPKTMTFEDVREYILYCKERVSPTDLIHEVNALKNLLEYLDNDAVSTCFRHYPQLKPTNRGHQRKSAMQDEMYDLILHKALTVPPTDFKMTRAYALVLLCINTGARNKEIRFSTVNDLSTVAWTFDIIHVKGEDTYGQSRQVPIPPEIREVVLNYLLARKKWVLDNNVYSPALFPSKESKDGFLSGNSIRRIKEAVESDLNIKFDLRMCRRTFGQRYLDNGLDIESASILMGHKTTRTTELYYSRQKLNHAIQNAKNTWRDDGES